ncbi:MAG: hypothetical protein IAE77_11205 [Prosthecobacter sp.]|uniref:hypothetical protein n=1 Tax=Prosthecobacter sp. TaxID=1965333 RepID=UPI001A0536A2|nr:hypothetical protein [Prosthecobacter sp.]MBE2284014.1 hypothetical protein [Prosthecobacter sp.]
MFDPTYPQDLTPIDATPMRNQLNSLKALIDAIATVTGAVVDSVNTLPAGEPAVVTVSVTDSTLHFTFDIPEGPQGVAGNDGGEGPPGPPFANAVVDAVNTLPAGDPANVTVSFDGTNVGFTFDIPQGHDGPTGADGPQGPAGPPGEVTGAELADAIADTVAGSSANSNSVDFLGSSAPPDYDAAVMQEVIDKVNELIGALRRSE